MRTGEASLLSLLDWEEQRGPVAGDSGSGPDGPGSEPGASHGVNGRGGDKR